MRSGESILFYVNVNKTSSLEFNPYQKIMWFCGILLQPASDCIVELISMNAIIILISPSPISEAQSLFYNFTRDLVDPLLIKIIIRANIFLMRLPAFCRVSNLQHNIFPSYRITFRIIKMIFLWWLLLHSNIPFLYLTGGKNIPRPTQNKDFIIILIFHF